MTKPRFNEVIIVEGKYDAAKLSSIVDALVITTDGFSIFSKAETKELIKRLGRERGLIILTDSDAAGFKIRNLINNIASSASIKNAYIPALKGKEARKPHASKEGLLGVEGVSAQIILTALRNAGAVEKAKNNSDGITFTDLYNLGISGTNGSSERKYALLKKLGLPNRLSKKALCEVLSALYTYEELEQLCSVDKPVLFWDFHGTLTFADGIWYSAAVLALKSTNALHSITEEDVRTEFYNSSLPWWKTEKQEISLCNSAWWEYFEKELCDIYMRCSVKKSDAENAVKLVRAIIMDKKTHRLYSDAITTLQELQNRGYKQYILSSNFPNLEKLATDMQIAHFFTKIISSADIGYDKPFASFYLEGLKIANSLAENAIMIGDNPVNDINAARAVGMNAIAVHNAVETQNATWSCKNLIDILDILK